MKLSVWCVFSCLVSSDVERNKQVQPSRIHWNMLFNLFDQQSSSLWPDFLHLWQNKLDRPEIDDDVNGRFDSSISTNWRRANDNWAKSIQLIVAWRKAWNQHFVLMVAFKSDILVKGVRLSPQDLKSAWIFSIDLRSSSTKDLVQAEHNLHLAFPLKKVLFVMFDDWRLVHEWMERETLNHY